MTNFPPIRHRVDLVELAARLAPSSACRRSFATGRVEVLGAFTVLPGSELPGYLLTVRTIRRRTYLLAVGIDTIKHAHRVWIAGKINWTFWAGELPYDTWRLRNGDHPETYDAKRQKGDIDAP